MKHLLAFLAMVSVAALPSAAQDNTSQQAAQISSIRQQIADLQAQLATVKANPPATSDAKIAQMESDLARVEAQEGQLEARLKSDPDFVRPVGPRAPVAPTASTAPGAITAPVAPAPARNSDTVKFGGDLVVGRGETINGDVANWGGKLVVDGRVDGEASVVGGSATINDGGSLGGDLNVRGGSAYVNGPVDAVTVIGGDLDLGPKALINGDVDVRGGSINRAPGAIIKGSTNVVGGDSGSSSGSVRHEESALLGGPLNLPSAVMLFIVGTVLLAAWPRRMDTVGRAFVARPGYSFLVGLVSFPGVVVLTILSAITIVGAIVVPLVWFGAVLMGITAAAMMLGRRMMIGSNYQSRFLPLLVGLAVWKLASIAAVEIGFLQNLICIAMGLVCITAIGAALGTGLGKSPMWLRDRMGKTPVAGGMFNASHTYAGTSDTYGDTL